MSKPQTNSEAAPRYPSTLAPEPYYQGLSDRITENLLPVFSRLFDLSTTFKVLELASGNGLHSLVYSRAFPKLEIQPTECDSFNVRRIDETCEEVRKLGSDEAGKGGVKPALELDIMKEEDWERVSSAIKSPSGQGDEQFDLVIGHNFLHMIPFPDGPKAIFLNLLKHNLVSRSHGLIAFYGPFKHDEGFFSENDEVFNKVISSRPSSYPIGLRSIDALARIAKDEGFQFVEKVAMPKMNWVLIFKPEGGEYPEMKWK